MTRQDRAGATQPRADEGQAYRAPSMRGARRVGVRAPAGFYPVNALRPHVVMAGTSLVCCACGAEGKAPLPKDVTAYNAAVAAFLELHKGCDR